MLHDIAEPLQMAVQYAPRRYCTLPSAADQNLCSGHIGRRVGGDEQHDRGDFLGLAGALERGRLRGDGAGFGLGDLGLDGAGRDDVDASWPVRR